jgi:hypothetical protein
VLVSTQHQDGIDRDTVIRPDLIEQVIRRWSRRRSPTTTTTSTSTRPASSWSVGRTATPASPGARSSSTRTAAWAARWRRVQRQGPEQGRPVRCVCRALGREARRRVRRSDTL